MWSQNKVKKALSRSLKTARANASYPLDAGVRCVIFSDHHRGARTRAEEPYGYTNASH